VFFRWLHKSWKYFWGIVFSLLLTILLVVAAAIGLLQLDVTQDYITDRIEQQVEHTYKADLSIGDLDGFLPFQLNLHDVMLTRTDSASSDTLLTVQQMSSKIDVWGLLQKKVTITSFSVDKPKLRLRSDAQGKIRLLERNPEPSKGTSKSGREPWLSSVEIVAPGVSVKDGAVYLESTTTKNQIGNLPPSFSLSNIQTELFVDWSNHQRYLDIESFSAKTSNLKMGQIEFSGQLYSDDRYLEFNSFYLTLGNSKFVLNGEIDGLNLLQPDFTGQFINAKYNLNINSDGFYLQDLSDLLGDLPEVESPLTMDIRTEGTTDSLWVDRASFEMDESIVNFNGLLKNLQHQQTLAYEIRLDQLDLRKPALDQLFSDFKAPQFRALEDLTASGKANGSLDSVSVNLSFESPLGQLTMKGQSQLAKPYRYQGSMEGTNLDVSSLLDTAVDTTSLNFSAELNGAGITLEDAVSNFEADFTNSRVNNINFESLTLSSSLDKGYWSHEYNYKNGRAAISGSGWVDFSRDEPPISMQGNAQHIDLANIFKGLGVASSELNFDYNVEMQDLTPNRIQGRANLDVKPSIIGGDSVRAHQLYMDLNSPDEQSRTFRLTSSLFDMNLTGQIVPGDIVDQAQYWAAYLSNRFKAEILMNAPANSQAAGTPPSRNVVVDGTIKAKDLGLIQRYLPDFPTINTDSRINFNVNTDGTRLLVSAEMQADTLFYDQLNFNNTRSQFTASFRSDQTFSDFSSVDFQANVGSLQTGKVDLDSINVDLSVKKDSLHLTQNIGSISDNARFRMALNSHRSDSTITVDVQNFFLGNTEYAWTNEEIPSLTYMRNGNIEFDTFSFQNRNEYFRLQGTFSKNRADSLTYILRDISLGRISDLIKGEVNFGGVLNGTLVTRSLTQQPTIQGELDVNRFALNQRMIGDVHFNSKYNPDKERFDTQINIVTDSTKYEQYLESNDDIGQNIRLDGYFVTPKPEVEQDTVYYFDADFKQIDMWVIPLIVNNVFSKMEGQASGGGYITGNLDDFDFHADFQTQNVYAKPNFLNTNYFISGHVGFDRQDGVILDSLNVMDTKGGTGVVNGKVDLNDFKPITYLDLTLDMNRLQFLNNKMDRDVPFYGNVSGSGVVRLTGSNRDLYMRTVNPVQLTSDSEVSIPLLEETELQQTGKFIRFVDSFDNPDKKTTTPGQELSADKPSEAEQLQEAIESMTFSERFDLDLQFKASNNVTVNLIFDPVTGEVLTAQGTGQLRITMQDQDVQMFGRYNINDGNYQFVTGEIISRRLDLEPGGTIIWEGPPDNARLNISAIYHARPDIRPLTAETAAGAGGDAQPNQNGGQRVPIDLIVEINGTLSSVENNYYFRLPTSIDLSSNSTLQYTISQINRDEQQKLLQATSILFTGQFIATQGLGSGAGSSSLNLTRSTVLNPLLSNQVISPLLSNQINALLNSDVSRLDIDLSLNAYDEVDLGIALRLYNDRLILRREGQIAGGSSQNSLSERIGDLNATYRIRRGLSLTAFHRQDQVLSSLRTTGSQAGDVTPTVDGIGLEAQLQFNTWQELLDRISNTFSRILGGNKKDDKKQNDDKLADQEAKKEEQN